MSEIKESFHLIFDRLENHKDNIFQALPEDAMSVSQIPYHIEEANDASDNPEKHKEANEALAAILDRLENIAGDIDLSDTTRLELYEDVRDSFVKILILNGPEMASNTLANFIMEHADFVTAFNSLEDKELDLRARRLKTLGALIAG